MPAAKPLPPPPPLCVLVVLPVFKSSLRPLSVGESDGWLRTAAGQPRTDESLGILVRLCREFGARQDLFCSVQAAGLKILMLENKLAGFSSEGSILERCCDFVFKFPFL